MATEIGKGVIPVTLDTTSVTSALPALSSMLGAKMGTMGKTAGGVLAAGIAAAVGAGVGLYKIGQTFDEMSDTIVQKTGASGKALRGFEKDAIAVGKNTPSSFRDIGVAIGELAARTGATGKPLQETARNILNLSRITGTDLKTNIAAMTRLFGDWSIPTNKQSFALDKLYRASQLSGIGVDKLAQLMVQFGSPLRQLGLGFDFTAAMFSRFEKEGVNIQTAMPGLRMALKNFAQAGREPAPALMETFEAIKNAGSTAKANTIAFETFGTRAGPDLAAAIREGRFNLDGMIGSLKDSKGAINDADKRTRDFGESWQIIKNNVLIPLRPIAEGLFSAIAEGAAKVAAGLPKFIENIKGMFSGLKDAGSGGSGVFSGIVDAFRTVASTVQPIISDIVDFVRKNWPAIKTTIKDVMDSVGEIISGAAKLIGIIWREFGDNILNIVKTVFGGIAGIVQGVLKVVSGIIKVATGIITGDWGKAWDGIKDIFSGVWGVLKAIVSTVLGVIKEIILAAWEWVWDRTKDRWNSIQDFLVGLWKGIKDKVGDAFGAIKDKLSDIWDGLKEKASSAWGAIRDKITGIADAVRDKLANIWESIKDKVTNVWGAIKDKITNVWDSIRDKVGNIAEAVRDKLANVWDSIRDKLGNIVESIRDKLGNVWESIRDKIGNVVEGIREKVGNVWENIREKVANVVEGIREKVGNVWEAIREKVGNAVDNIREKVGNVWEGIREKTRNVWDGIRDFLGNLLNTIGDKFRTAVNRIGDIWADLKDKARRPVEFVVNTVYNNGIRKVINAIPGVGNIPEIRFARGGPVVGGTPGKDSVRALLMPGEHVLTAAEVKALGGQRSVYRLRESIKRGIFQKQGDFGYPKGKPVTVGDAMREAWVPFALGGAAIDRAKAWAWRQAGKPYVWGGTGPGGFDCSGFMSGVTNVLRGGDGYGTRYGTTATFPWPGFLSGFGQFTIGNSRRYGHMGGTLDGLGVESTNGAVRVGSSARNAGNSMFEMHGHLGSTDYVPGGGGGGDANWFEEAISALKDFLGKVKGWFDRLHGMGDWGGMMVKMAGFAINGVKDWIADKLPDIGDIIKAVGGAVTGAISKVGDFLGFDTGGILQSGGVAVNRSGRPERVLDPRTTRNFDALTAALDSGAVMIVAPSVDALDASVRATGSERSSDRTSLIPDDVVEELRQLRAEIRALPRDYRLGERKGA